MKRILLFLVFIQISLIHYGQIIADHTVVDKFDKIPQQYIDEVKKMWVTIPGESHSEGYRTGALLLEQANPTYAVSVVESGTPEAYTDTNLRLSRATWGNYANETGWQYAFQSIDAGGGESTAYTYNAAEATRIAAGLAYAHANNLTIAAFGIGYCYWDGWYVSYITCVQAYIDYCVANSVPTKVFFTTGPVDNYMAAATEGAYNSSLRWTYIRDYVNADETRILFDYADILSYNDAGVLQTQTWGGHTFNVIHPDNMEGAVGVWASGHIGGNGCMRIAKAMWWMLARMAGWNGVITGIDDSSKDASPLFIEQAQDEIRIKLEDSYLSATVSLYNIQGRLMTEKKVGNNLCIINTSHLASGIYLLSLSKSKILKTQKIIIP